MEEFSRQKEKADGLSNHCSEVKLCRESMASKYSIRNLEKPLFEGEEPTIISTYYNMTDPVVQPNNTITANLIAGEENNMQAGSLTMSVTFY